MDAAACAAVYAYGIEGSHASFEEVAPTPEMAARIATARLLAPLADPR